jgi:hypothetical protein
MDDEGHTLVRAGIAAFVIAAVIVGIILVRNWLAFEVVANAVGQPKYVFPTSQVQYSLMGTPWALGTPFDLSIYYWATPTPTMEGGVYIWNP